jgi:rubrerythrin
MVTLVGTQTDYLDALKALVELEHDALEAYIAAINRLDNAEYKQQLESFKSDHERHIKDLSGILKKHGITPPTDPTLKSILTQGKVVICNMVNDKAILAAMGTNEDDTNTAYDRLNHYKDIPADEKKILEQAFEDEKRHKAWILQALK